MEGETEKVVRLSTKVTKPGACSRSYFDITLFTPLSNQLEYTTCLDNEMSQAPPDTSKDETTREISASEDPQVKDEAEKGEDQPRARRKRMGVDPSLIISEERSKRRRTPSPAPETEGKVKKEDGGDAADPKDPEKAAAVGKELYAMLMGLKGKE